MEWQPITEIEIWDLINRSYQRMTLEQRRIWQAIKVAPHKWQQGFDDKGNGFWVVAIIGSTAIWYNDIENGFNRSSFNLLGTINEYHCNQDNLEVQIQHVINQLRDGYNSTVHASSPINNFFDK